MSGGSSGDTPPWASAELTCIGWIPSADGHLSFSLIGQGTQPTCHRYSGMVAGTGKGKSFRSIAVFQQRKTLDIPALFRWFMPSAHHHWLLTGDALPAKYHTDPGEPHPILDQQGMLRGQILFIPYQDERDSDGWPKDATWAKIRDQIVTTLRPDRNPDEAGVFTELADELGAMKEAGLTTVSVEYAFFRTGEIHLWLEAGQVAKIAPVAVLTGGEPARASEIPKSHTLLRQAYYFVKDAAHYHVHHDGSSDQIVPLVFDQAEDSSVGSHGQPSVSEQSWQRETLWGLSRSIEELVRQGTRDALRNALGFICFAESFQSTLAGHVRKNGHLNDFAPVANIHRYDFKSLRESVRIALERNTWSLAGKAAMAGTVAAISLSSIIATNALGNHPGVNQASIWDGPLTRFIYQFPFAPPMICTMIVVLVFLWIYAEAGFLKPLFRIENAWSRFVRSHLRFAMARYNGHGKDWLSFFLTVIIFPVPICVLGFAMWWLLRYFAW